MAEKNKDAKRDYNREEPVNLAPLSFKEALAALVRVKREDAEQATGEQESGEAEGETADKPEDR